MDEEDKNKDISDIFRKVVVNIPLLYVIKQILKYAKFLKDLYTHKRRLKGNEIVNMGRNVSYFIHPMHVFLKVKTSDQSPFSLSFRY